MDIGYMTSGVMKHGSKKQQQKIAVQLENGTKWSYEELDRISNQYANRLKELGVEKGDRVGILLYNCLEYFGLYFAAAKIGAIAVRLNFRLTSHEFEYVLNDSGVKVLCFHSALSDTINEIKDMVKVEEYICLPNKNQHAPEWALDWETMNKAAAMEVNTDAIQMEDPVMLMYTSGTTGRPKGAVWTHANTYWFSMMQIMKWNFTGKEIGMTTGPLYHVGAMEDTALPIIMAGGTLVISKSGGFDINRIMQVMERQGVTDCFMYPFMIYEMLQAENDSIKLETLKHIYTGGDSLMPWSVEQMSVRFPHIGISQVYGLTEGTPIAASLDAEDIFTKGHTVGKPLPLTDIKIVDPDKNILGTDEIGEIAVRSPVVSNVYWKKPEATAETFVDGWCFTGDLGCFDEDGYLSIAGRKKDMIRSGGENIYAAEIEDVLMRHDKVIDASIIGVPDPKFIETVCAIIVKKEGVELTKQEVVDHCKNFVASYKKPRKVIFVEELPRTPSGKVQKYILRSQYGDGAGMNI
ncbi:class I adenylate-forming enzyme family protein [Virgibacillus siamensis]|uniref:class I adenylate-forming enzyme family protein n=1 Tax=Virgibacillus siamensis TaxID=480071 RepID=UPI00098432D6|nr:AMP-binding protein [Virgibacillus siamensis]